MAYTNFYVTKGAAAANTNGGGPRLGANDGPVYAIAAHCNSDHAGTTLTDTSGSNWAGVLVDDWLCFNGTDFSRVAALAPGADATKVTVSPAVTIDQADKNCNVGGAWATVQFPFTTMTTVFVNAAGAPPRCNIKYSATAYAETAVTFANSGTALLPLTFEGYEATAGDFCPNGNLPIVDGTGLGGANGCIYGSAKLWLRIGCIRALHSTLKAVVLANCTNTHLYRVKAKSTGAGLSAFFLQSLQLIAAGCYADGGAFAGFYSTAWEAFYGCLARGCGYGFYTDAVSIALMNCIADANADDGIYANVSPMAIIGCTSMGSAAGSGIRIVHADTYQAMMLNNILYGNNQYGIECNQLNTGLADWNAIGGNGVGARSNIVAGLHDVTLTASPFVAAGNLTLNNAPGGGALCKAAGMLGTLLDGVSIGRGDIGALQHRSARRSRGRIHGV